MYFMQNLKSYFRKSTFSEQNHSLGIENQSSQQETNPGIRIEENLFEIRCGDGADNLVAEGGGVGWGGVTFINF